jgi:DNA-binding beta-propeller fold protein YncE
MQMATTSNVNEIVKSRKAEVSGRTYFLDLGAGRVLSAKPNGSDLQIVIPGGQQRPDGIAADPDRGHLYWTNMGNPVANDGSIVRCDLDGGNVTIIVPPGSTFTPKQLQIELKSRKLYWSDREGMRVMRCNLDGSNVETLVETGKTVEDRRDSKRWCVGMAVDPDGGKIYWTQKGGDNAGEGRIFRAGIELPAGRSPSTRTDIELLYADLPEPIDLDLDPANGMLYLDRPR